MSGVARSALLVACATVAVAGAACGACTHRDAWPGPKETAPPATAPASVAPAARPFPSIADRPLGPHPRILLTPDRLAALSARRAAGAPSWRKLVEACDEDARSPIDSGYEAWDWVNATLALAICAKVTPRADYAKAALQYFVALLDDRSKVGDGAGGDSVVRHDDGYAMRTHGCFGAIAYDWLVDLPGMTPSLRRHAADRILAWARWYGESGYNRDQPIANYYAGYFGAVAFGGLALGGDDPRAASLRLRTQEMFKTEIAPTFKARLAGGDFPEGWQYGDMVGAILAMFASAQSALGTEHSVFDELPWLRAIPEYRAHALLPDGKHTLDSGDWSDKPAVAPPHALLALAAVLPASDPAGKHARALARLAADPNEEWRWLVAIADDPSRAADDPRHGPLSRLTLGTEVVTARTDWSPQAVWFALASAPSLADHQHLDAGHFEIVRGADALVIDAGGYGSYSSLSHNVVVVDDRKENDNYSPNQGTWSDSAKIVRFEDRGAFVYALADYTSAYNPAGYPGDHPERSVTRAEREAIFSRTAVPGLGPESARVVIYDRLTLSKPSYGATFLIHGGAPPERLEAIRGAVRFRRGASEAIVTTLIPIGATPAFVNEPTNVGDGAFYANDPPEGTTSVRVEVRSAQGETERRFLHAIVVGARESRLPLPGRVEGEGIDGVVIEDEAYVFARGATQVRPAPIAYRSPPNAARHLVASLAPRGHYGVSVERAGDVCRVALRAGEGRIASNAGTLLLDVTSECSLTTSEPSPAPDAPSP